MDNSLYLTGCSNFPNDCGPLSADIEIEGVGVCSTQDISS